MKLESVTREQIPTIVKERKQRTSEDYVQIDQRVQIIVNAIRQEGDEAVFRYIKELDHADINELVATQAEIDAAFEATSKAFQDIVKEAKTNITAYHEEQREKSWYTNQEDGVWLGQQVRPIDRVGVYVPGGKAAYPSTVLMNVIPAKVAGVEKITVTTPVQEDGSIHPNTLIAASIAGADEILKVGGAHGIAALAYGTETVTPVDKIVGPGNAYVARAKKMVFGDVGIDMIAGPSEVCVIADEYANPAFVAADMLAQAEHDELASSIVVTTSQAFAERVKQEVEAQTEQLNRQSIINQSIKQQGALYVVDDLKIGFELVNELAPEHLEVHTENPFEQLEKIKHAGAIFLGEYAPEALGDYFAGPNHTLPTNGTAKFSSPLGVYDFMKKSSVIYYNEEALGKVVNQIDRFALEEGLDGHAASVKKRFE
ncbi:histidinol dehydrogenase [Halalkalibacillus halophilus]|uniref:histidinol dehydrogenase n=1 Tax=Halalkalibacillus halophilus TaxID=392827 RepID=UPI00041334CF|nr:histidinol dehydrogenase [Halalkalibacillus halophilus]